VTAFIEAETEAGFAAALDQAIATGLPVQVTAEVARRFGLDEHGPNSAEAEDMAGRPYLTLSRPVRFRALKRQPRTTEAFLLTDPTEAASVPRIRPTVGGSAAANRARIRRLPVTA